MLGGGRDRQDLDLLDPDGHRPLDTVNPNSAIGCHVGLYAGLNIFNAQPNFHYSWANDNPRSRLLVRQRGGQIVDSNSPEMAAYHELVDHDHTPLDSAEAGYPGVILVRTPIEVERRRRELEDEQRQSLLRDGHAEGEYVRRGERNPDEMEYGARRRLSSLRFATSDHMSSATAGPEPDARTLDMWSPRSGIVREG